jgi:hypothetical protein
MYESEGMGPNSMSRKYLNKHGLIMPQISL